MKNDIIKIKKELRKIQSVKRIEIHKQKKICFNKKLFLLLSKKINFKDIEIVSSFFSINSEIRTNDLNDYLWSCGKRLSFPVVKEKDKVLIFREQKKNQSLVFGNYNVPEPSKINDEVYPELIFVPCLAFDLKGYRLGYGGGYYDKTLYNFKKINHNYISVGFAYHDQQITKVPTNKYDYKLDFVLTEKQLYTFT